MTPSTVRHVGFAALFVALACPLESAGAKTVEVPLNIGVGPALYLISGPVFRDQALHYGLHISMNAVIDNKTIRDNIELVPKQYRSMAKQLHEVRIGHFLIPDSFFISSKIRDTGLVGVTWRPLGLTVPLVREPVRFAVSVGLMVTFFYMNSDTLAAQHTFFFRPGLDARAELEIPFSKTFLLSIGWSSAVYIPQVIGGGFFDLKPVEQFIWHIGQPYLLLNFRVPYKAKI